VKTVRLRAGYYRQFDADLTREIPAEAFHGWTTAEVPLALDHTAVVVMHAWDCGTPAQYPGWRRVGEFIPRTEEICRSVFPRLLSAVRASPLRLFHVVSGGTYYQRLPGYKKAARLAGRSPKAPEQIQPDPVWEQLQRFRVENTLGKHNLADIGRGFANLNFPAEAMPQGEEGVAANARQLLALCKESGVNHLVYVGFAINECLHQAPAGMVDMSRHGFLCSTIRQAVTAVESKETARGELGKEMALWRVGRLYGFLFDVEEFIRAISVKAK